jgi:hypothetical protein
MAAVTKEMICEVLEQVQSHMAALEESLRGSKAALNAIRTHMVAMQQDIHNIYTILIRHESRLDRIERRLEISEVPG